ncbi:hypothetical protein [uncultured Ruminococcus sp.]|nr:hypothetical protein [uncultured Ruminococcus sp.]
MLRYDIIRSSLLRQNAGILSTANAVDTPLIIAELRDIVIGYIPHPR